jgi:enoyl-CoA hydratase
MSVHTERSGPVTTIIMERPNVRNAVDPATADALALEIARFPQGAVRADRRSAYRQHGLSVRAAMEQEWANGAGTLAEAIQGAGRFASGKGRHGAFDDI